LRQKGYNSNFVRDISKIFASMGGFGGQTIERGQSNSITTDTLKGQDRDCKISVARYLRNWSTVGKRYFTNKTANINVQNISLYTC